jgi:hypothetical protein
MNGEPGRSAILRKVAASTLLSLPGAILESAIWSVSVSWGVVGMTAAFRNVQAVHREGATTIVTPSTFEEAPALA